MATSISPALSVHISTPSLCREFHQAPAPLWRDHVSAIAPTLAEHASCIERQRVVVCGAGKPLHLRRAGVDNTRSRSGPLRDIDALYILYQSGEITISDFSPHAGSLKPSNPNSGDSEPRPWQHSSGSSSAAQLRPKIRPRLHLLKDLRSNHLSLASTSLCPLGLIQVAVRQHKLCSGYVAAAIKSTRIDTSCVLCLHAVDQNRVHMMQARDDQLKEVASMLLPSSNVPYPRSCSRLPC